ncbi:MAG: hypothetical protein NVS2B5_12460 [Beijerinckiaceae bacterium]
MRKARRGDTIGLFEKLNEGELRRTVDGDEEVEVEVEVDLSLRSMHFGDIDV